MQSADDTNELLYLTFELIPSREEVHCGYRTDYLLTELTELENNLVICPECRGIMREAVLSSSSITCRQCAESDEAKPFQKVRDSIANLEIGCPLQRDCDWKGILSEAEEHLMTCAYLLVECSLGCQEVMMKSEVNNHMSVECHLRKIPCVFCKRTGVAKDLEQHKKVCHMSLIRCPNGCSRLILRGRAWRHNKICPKFELMCPFEYLMNGPHLICSDYILCREDIPEHNAKEYATHLDMLHFKILLLEDRLNEMELKLKCKKDLDGFEWEIVNPFTGNDECLQGPENYVYGYRLRIFALIKETRCISFWLCRVEGDNDGALADATLTECRVILIDRDKPSESKFNYFPLDYELKIGRESDTFGVTRIPKSENRPIFRFYFDINNSQLEDIKSVYETETEPMPDTF